MKYCAAHDVRIRMTYGPLVCVDDSASGDKTKPAATADMLTTVDKNKQAWEKLSSSSPMHRDEDDSILMKFDCMNSVVDWLSRGRDPKLSLHADDSLPVIDDDVHLQVLVTGSLYLVGSSFVALREKLYSAAG